MTTRLFHISDVHFGVEDRQALKQVEQAVLDERPDALVCTGDLTQRARHRQYAAAAEWFAGLDVPVWLDPGNHDMPYYNLWERFRDPFRRFRRLQGDVAVAHFETDDVVLVPLNTTVSAQRRWPWSDGVVTRAALNRTIDALKALEGDGRTIIVTAHHPLHGPKVGGPSDTIGGNDAFNRLTDVGMDAIMTGHIHRPFNEGRPGPERSAQVIGAGTLSTRLRHGAPPSYNVLTCNRKTTEVAVELRIVGDLPQ
ncbi:MAG: metallophosphoesterase [Pseudomonadota bacterium]